MTNTQAAVVDFGTSKIVTIIAESNKTERSEIIGTGSVLYDGFQDGDWNTPEQLVRSVKNSIAAAELQARRSIQEIYVGVPGEYIEVVTQEVEVDIQNGVVTDADIDNVYDAAAEAAGLDAKDGIVLHRSHAWFSVDNGRNTINPQDLQGERLRGRISFILGQRQFMNDVAEVMGMLNITIMGYLSSTLGTALLMVDTTARDDAAVMIDVGYLNTQISIVEGDAVTWNGIIKFGGVDITLDLAEKLGISMKEAERIKRRFNFNPDAVEEEEVIEVRNPDTGMRETVPMSEIRRIVKISMRSFQHEVRNVLEDEVYNRVAQNSRYYLTGGGIAMMRNGTQALSELLGLDLSTMTNRTSKLNYPMFTTALGLSSLVFDSIQQEPEETQKFSPFDGVKNIFRKK